MELVWDTTLMDLVFQMKLVWGTTIILAEMELLMELFTMNNSDIDSKLN